MVSQAELILRVITLWFLVLPQFFRDVMGPFYIIVQGQMYPIPQNQAPNVNLSYSMGLWTLGSFMKVLYNLVISISCCHRTVY